MSRLSGWQRGSWWRAGGRCAGRITWMVLLVANAAFGRLELTQIAILPRTLHVTWPCGDANRNGFREIYGAGDDESLVVYECEPGNGYREYRPGLAVNAVYDYGDADGDGLAELLAAKRYPIIFESAEPGAFPTESVWGVDPPVVAYRSGFADLDRDGHCDIVFCSNNSAGIAVFEHRANGQFESVFFPFSYATGDFALGDFDRDGMNELVAGSNRYVVYVFDCTGDDQYVLAAAIDVSPDRQSYDVASANDMDGNGLPEFIVVSTSGRDSCTVRIFEEPRHREYVVVWQGTLPALRGVFAGCAVVTGDADGDGVDEFAVSTGLAIRLFKSTGPRQYEQTWQYDRPYIRQMRFFDTNSNGRAELIISPCSTYIFEDTTGLLFAPYEKQSRRTPAVARPTVARIGVPVRLDALPMESEVEVVNAEGRAVLRHRVSGRTFWRWDQRDEKGMPVPVGNYYCVVRARGQSTSLKLCVVK